MSILHWSHASGAHTWLSLTFGWTLMMSVMMMPTVAPWIGAFHRFGVARNARSARLVATALFAAGYFVIWAAFGGAVAVAQTWLTPQATVGSWLLAGAGVFQLTPLKQACLTHCRNPFSFFLTRWNDGPLSGFRLGASHGAYCVGCCWALMLASFAVGLTSLAWMAALAATTFAEQTLPFGARLRVPIGLLLVGGGVWKALAS